MEGKYALLIVYLKKEYIMDFVGIKKKNLCCASGFTL